MRWIVKRWEIPWTLGILLGLPTLGAGQATQAPPAQPAAPAATANQGASANSQSSANQGSSASPATPPRGVDPASAARMEELLGEWEKRSQADESLYAEFTRTDHTVEFPKDRKFRGIALLHRPNQACLNFEEVVDGKPRFHERIVATGDEVYHFQGPTKQVFVYPLAQDQRRRALEEGPLPFMFNMRASAAKERFQMDLLKELPATEDQPPRSLIRIIPLLKIDRDEYVEARVVLNLETFLPMGLVLTLPNGKDTKTFIFSKIERNGQNNPAVNANNYNGEQMAGQFRQRGYKVVVNPDGVGEPQAPQSVGSQAPSADRPVAQPAQRPQAGAAPRR